MALALVPVLLFWAERAASGNSIPAGRGLGLEPILAFAHTYLNHTEGDTND